MPLPGEESLCDVSIIFDILPGFSDTISHPAFLGQAVSRVSGRAGVRQKDLDNAADS